MIFARTVTFIIYPFYAVALLAVVALVLVAVWLSIPFVEVRK